MQRPPLRILTAATLTAALALAGCSAGGDDASTTDAAVGTATTRAGDDAAAPAEQGAGGDGVAGGEAGADPEAAPDAMATAADGDDAGALTVAAATGRQVIHRATLTLESDDPEATAEAARRAAEEAGGFVAGTDLSRVDGTLQGGMTLRVPSEDLQGTLEQLRTLDGVATVTGERIDTEDVTGEITDVESQLRNLRTVEGELRTLLADVRESSQSADQVLSVFQRIRDVRSEIEQLEGRRANLTDLVALATVELQITPSPAAAAPPAGPEPWLAGRVVDEALQATTGALQGLATAGIWLALTVLPVLALTAGPLLAAVWLLRRRRVSGAPAEGS